MTLQGTGTPFVYPPPFGPNYSGAFQFNTMTMDASGEMVGWIMQVPKAGDIHKIIFRTVAVTTSNALKVGIWNLDASGLPNMASAYKSMTVGTVASVAATTAYTITLGADAVSAVRGDWIAVVVEFDTYVAGNLQIASGGAAGANQSHHPYCVTAPGGVWGKSASLPVGLLEYSDGSYAYAPGINPWVSGLTSTAFAQDSTPDEYALKFQLPYPSRIMGFSGWFNTNEDHSFVLYDSDGSTVLETLVQDSDYTVADATRYCEFMFDTAISLSKNTNYYLSLKSTENTNTVAVLIGTVPTAAAMDSNGGQNFLLATQTGAGGWTATTTQRPLIYLFLDQADDAAGTGGSKVAGGFVG